MSPTPLLFIGDSPDLRTGLGRIGRDLASLCCQLPQFRVGFLGRAGIVQYPQGRATLTLSHILPTHGLFHRIAARLASNPAAF